MYKDSWRISLVITQREEPPQKGSNAHLAYSHKGISSQRRHHSPHAETDTKHKRQDLRGHRQALGHMAWEEAAEGRGMDITGAGARTVSVRAGRSHPRRGLEVKRALNQEVTMEPQ